MPAIIEHPSASSQPSADIDYYQAVDALSLPPLLPTNRSPRVALPGGHWVDLLLTALTPISHHDPAVTDKSNTVLFNRRRQLAPPGASLAPLSPAVAEGLVSAFPVPGSITDLFAGLSLPEFVACALAGLFLDFYNAGEGVGVFEGPERYTRLESRLKGAAVRAMTLRGLWDRLTHALQVPIHPTEADRRLLPLLALPRSLQAQTLGTLTRDYRTVVSLARLWHDETKCQSADYAAKAKRPQAPPSVPLAVHALSLTPSLGDASSILDVPHVSGNSLRHQVVRGPGWRHLSDRLGLPAGQTGQGELSAGVEAVFENGGNIDSDAKRLSAPFALAAEVRKAHPLLELLGGCADSFTLGESRLHVAPWIVCRENAAALRGTPAENLPALAVSVFDLLDEVTETRQATARGEGQMIHSFETLCAGTQILCRLHLAPDTGRLALGALAASVETYLHGLATAGGSKARGFGWMIGVLLCWPPAWEESLAEYEHYLDGNAEALRAGLTAGTLTLSSAGTRVVT